jgi:multidrug efflux pump
MLAKFFIERPVFAVVISVVIVVAGFAALNSLPIAQYPEITPPTVQVTCNYPGANAKVVQETVAAPIEQQVNGVERMLYMSSQCTNDGGYNLTVTFELGTDINMAQVLVQNRVNQAVPTLPDTVKVLGVTTLKKSPAILLVVNLFSEDDPKTKQSAFDQLYISNYATINIKDELARVAGVGDVTMMGQQDYSMRIWLDPATLTSKNLTSNDVVSALKEQNVQVAAGSLGRPPAPMGQQFQYSLSTLGRLTEPEQFGNIVIRSAGGGQTVYLKDLGRLELGAKAQDVLCRLDGKPSAGLAIYQLPGSNALVTAEHVKDAMKRLEKRFPPGLKYAIVYDTTPFIEESVHEVFKTLYEAIILVAIVVLFFLQDWKAMILPMIDVPVSLIGTLAIMYAMGFTLNNLTLFGLVLAIGIVVDDAIIVLENIERWMAQGLNAKDATIAAMNEITVPIIGITLVLCSVLIPSAFLPGITGQFYKQFALTICASMLISAINAMTMTPSRAALIFKSREGKAHGGHGGHGDVEALPWWGTAFLFGYAAYFVAKLLLPGIFGVRGQGEDHAAPAAAWKTWIPVLIAFAPGAFAGWMLHKPTNAFLAVIFGAFNRGFDRLTEGFARTERWVLRLAFIVGFVYLGLLGLTTTMFKVVPGGFIPAQDKGYLLVNIQLPDSSSLERTLETTKKIEKIVFDTKGVIHTVAIPGQSFVLNAVSSNYGSMFVILDDFGKRQSPELYSDVIAQKLRKRFYDELPEATIAVFGPPAVDGLGNTGGFKLMVQDRGDMGLDALQGQAESLAENANLTPGFAGVISTFRSNAPQLYVDIDRVKCKNLGVPLSEVFQSLQVNLGGFYVNDFNRFGRTWQVNVQADAEHRLQARQVGELKVRNQSGQMVPLSTVAEVRDTTGPTLITRYNMFPAATINGANQPGFSTGQAISGMEKLADDTLASSMAIEWTELTFLEIKAGGAAAMAFLYAILLVYLVLGSLYESYSMPVAVLLVVPMCVLSALVGIWIARMDLNIFVQIGFIVLVGLAAKNAILVVDFARETKAKQKISAFEAAIHSAKLRLRPIVMTSFAFILGVVPLMVSKGAGAEMRRTLGVAVFSGMLGVTFFGLFLTPMFYYVIERLFGGEPPPQEAKTETAVPPLNQPDNRIRAGEPTGS